MEPATERTPLDSLSAFLAGLQAGMVGAGWMLAWLGLSSIYQRKSFWLPENLMASVFYGGDAIRNDFNAMTFSGLALYLLVYSSLGAVFAAVLRDRVSPGRLLLLAILFGVAWYYFAFRMIGKAAMPLVSLLHAERPTLLGHLIYGTFLGRYPAYLPRVEVQAPPEAEPVPATESSAEDAPAPEDHSPM